MELEQFELGTSFEQVDSFEVLWRVLGHGEESEYGEDGILSAPAKCLALQARG